MPYTHLPSKVTEEVLTLSNYNTIKNNFAGGVPDVVIAKGDLSVGSGADAATRLAVGADDTTLVADSLQIQGQAWQIQPAARVRNSADLLTGITSWQALTFDAERFDTDGMHSTVTNASRLTVPTGGDGLYLIGGTAKFQITFPGPMGGYFATLGLRVVLNGTTVIVCAGDGYTAYPAASISGTFDITTLYALAAGDYVELQRYASTNSPAGVLVAANFSPEFWAVWQRRS